MKRIGGTIPRPLAEVWPQLDAAAAARGWQVSPSSTIYKRFYSRGMGAFSNGYHITCYLHGDDSVTRLTFDVSATAIVDSLRSRKRIGDLLAVLGGSLDPD